MKLSKLFTIVAPTPKPVEDQTSANAAQAVVDEVHRQCQSLQGRGSNGRYRQRYSSDGFSTSEISQGSSTKTDYRYDAATGKPIQLDHYNDSFDRTWTTRGAEPLHFTHREYECHMRQEQESTVYSRRIYDRNARGFVHTTEVVRVTPGQPLEYAAKEHLDGKIGSYFHQNPMARNLTYFGGATLATAGALMASGSPVGFAGAVGCLSGVAALSVAFRIAASERYD